MRERVKRGRLQNQKEKQGKIENTEMTQTLFHPLLRPPPFVQEVSPFLLPHHRHTILCTTFLQFWLTATLNVEKNARRNVVKPEAGTITKQQQGEMDDCTHALAPSLYKVARLFYPSTIYYL